MVISTDSWSNSTIPPVTLLDAILNLCVSLVSRLLSSITSLLLQFTFPATAPDANNTTLPSVNSTSGIFPAAKKMKMQDIMSAANNVTGSGKRGNFTHNVCMQRLQSSDCSGLHCIVWEVIIYLLSSSIVRDMLRSSSPATIVTQSEILLPSSVTFEMFCSKDTSIPVQIMFIIKRYAQSCFHKTLLLHVQLPSFHYVKRFLCVEIISCKKI